MDETEFWRIVERVGWPCEYLGLDKSFLNEYGTEKYLSVVMELSKKADRLMTRVESFEKFTGDSCEVGDDGFAYLANHIVGLGEAEYSAVMKNPRRAIQRGKKRDYKESFAYVFHL